MQQQQYKTIEDVLNALTHARKTIENCENLLRTTFIPLPPMHPPPLEAFKSAGKLSLPPLPSLPSLTNYQHMMSSGFVTSASQGGSQGYKSILFPEKDLSLDFSKKVSTFETIQSIPKNFLEILNNEISQSISVSTLEKKPIDKVFYSSSSPPNDYDAKDDEIISTSMSEVLSSEVLTPLKINKKFKIDKFQQNVLRILINEFTNAKLEKRDVIPFLPPNLKSMLDPENMPPKRSPHNESFTSLIAKIKEVQTIWIRRNSSKDESLLEAERAYVLAPTFITNYFG